MNEPLTAAEQNEIVEYITGCKPGRIMIDIGDADKNEGWAIVVHNEAGAMVSWMHPRTFLDIIRDVPPGETVLKHE